MSLCIFENTRLDVREVNAATLWWKIVRIPRENGRAVSRLVTLQKIPVVTLCTGQKDPILKVAASTESPCMWQYRMDGPSK